MKTINANCFSINPLLITMALNKAGLMWSMPRSQYQAVLCYLLIRESESTTIHMPNLFDIPVCIDEELPEGVIELRLYGDVLTRIENLAVPIGMERK